MLWSHRGALHHLRIQTDVEDQEVVTYIYTAPTALVVPGAPGAELLNTIRTPLLEMAPEEQHQRTVQAALSVR
jgi:hypothetical protein